MSLKLKVKDIRVWHTYEEPFERCLSVISSVPLDAAPDICWGKQGRLDGIWQLLNSFLMMSINLPKIISCKIPIHILHLLKLESFLVTYMNSLYTTDLKIK